MYLFFDTETDGIPDYAEAPDAPCQPHILQLAAILCDGKGNEMASFKTLILPSDWQIDEQSRSFETNRITQAMCETYGMKISNAIRLLHTYYQAASLIIAHNIKFDREMLQIETARLGSTIPTPARQPEPYCTAEAMTPICNIPPTEKMLRAGFNKSKTPNLAEAYRFCTGKEIEKAHDAMADVRACKDVFFWMMDQGRVIPA